jgi:hypothetical protein
VFQHSIAHRCSKRHAIRNLQLYRRGQHESIFNAKSRKLNTTRTCTPGNPLRSPLSLKCKINNSLAMHRYRGWNDTYITQRIETGEEVGKAIEGKNLEGGKNRWVGKSLKEEREDGQGFPRNSESERFLHKSFLIHVAGKIRNYLLLCERRTTKTYSHHKSHQLVHPLVQANPHQCYFSIFCLNTKV